MKFLFASDSCKGTISSSRAAELLSDAARDFFPSSELCAIEVADGGEGTVDAVVAAVGGTLRTVKVHGPLGESVQARYGLLGEGRAIIEMAAASGLPLLLADERDPRKTSTQGTGELIADALDQGVRELSLAIGGSATNDAGMGCMRALGARFLDAAGDELAGTGSDLARVDKIDLAGMDGRLGQVRVTVMCDVDNPLLGPRGATRIFGPQKGATPAVVEELEAAWPTLPRCWQRRFLALTQALPALVRQVAWAVRCVRFWVRGWCLASSTYWIWWASTSSFVAATYA